MPRRRKSSTPVNNESTPTEVEHLKAELATANERKHSLEEELENARTTVSRVVAVDGSAKALTDGDIPVFLDRSPLRPEDQLALDAIMAAWANSPALQAVLVGASPVVQERFIAALREHIASASSAAE